MEVITPDPTERCCQQQRSAHCLRPQFHVLLLLSTASAELAKE